jgi:hypothetical protein
MIKISFVFIHTLKMKWTFGQTTMLYRYKV